MSLNSKATIESGKAILGIEFGSTRIKAVLIDEENKPIAQGSHEWENQLVDGLWTYSVEAIWYGLQDCYADLRANVKKQYDTEIETLAAMVIWHLTRKKKFLFLSVHGEIQILLKQLLNFQICLFITFHCVGVSHICIRQSWIMKSM